MRGDTAHALLPARHTNPTMPPLGLASPRRPGVTDSITAPAPCRTRTAPLGPEGVSPLAPRRRETGSVRLEAQEQCQSDRHACVYARWAGGRASTSAFMHTCTHAGTQTRIHAPHTHTAPVPVAHILGPGSPLGGPCCVRPPACPPAFYKQTPTRARPVALSPTLANPSSFSPASSHITMVNVGINGYASSPSLTRRSPPPGAHPG